LPRAQNTRGKKNRPKGNLGLEEVRRPQISGHFESEEGREKRVS